MENKDQVELLTQDVKHILDNLPVKQPHPHKDTLRDSIVEESEDPAPPGEGPLMNAFLTGLSWAVFAVAIAATAFITWYVGNGLAK